MEPYLIVLSAFGLIVAVGGFGLGYIYLTRNPAGPLLDETRTVSALSDRVNSLHEIVNESKARSRAAEATADKVHADIKKFRDQLNGTISAEARKRQDVETQVSQLIGILAAPQVAPQQQGEAGPVDPQFDFSSQMR